MQSANKIENYLISLASLFHDIGKFFQRALSKKGEERQKEYKDKFGYLHAFYSYKAITEELKDGLNAVFTDKEIEKILDGVYHHKPTTKIQHVFQKADWVSSSEREEERIKIESELGISEEEILKNFIADPRLISIFDKINLKDDSTEKSDIHFYKIVKLSKNLQEIFPLSLNDKYIKESLEYSKINIGDYQTHWDDFKEEFNKKLTNLGIKFADNPDFIFSLIYHLLYKYLWCIPASVYDKENKNYHYPDISLFDHSRVLSAIAVCLKDYLENNEKNIEVDFKNFKSDFDKTKTFLYVKGDISGIQKFIYKVYGGRIAKTLRGRSFYLTLLPEVLSRYIVRQFNYPITNILYCGGGIFELLIANTEENKKKLNELRKSINKFLAEHLEAEIGLSLATYECSPVDLMDNERLKGVLRGINENLDKEKRQKFKYLIESGEIEGFLNKNIENIEHLELCPRCRTYMKDEEKEICDKCEQFEEIGSNLPKIEFLVFAEGNPLGDYKEKVEFGDFGNVYMLSKDQLKTQTKKVKGVLEILEINNPKFNDNASGFKFIGKVVPVATEEIETDDKEEGKILKDQIISFNILSEYADGDSKIGILQADVDNLGLIFSSGLKGKASISRIATLSRMLDLFFSGYLNRICEDLSGKYLKEDNAEINNLFYILYSGGDDVFIIAPWDKTLDVSLEIRKKFDELTGNNKNLSISAGYIQTKPKFTIRLSANYSKEAESVAKESGKNRIVAFGDVLKWDRMESVKNVSNYLAEKINEKQLQRGFIYSLYTLREQFLKDTKARRSPVVYPYSNEVNLMFYPYFHYYVARNIKEKEEFLKLFFDNLGWKDFSKIKDGISFLINYTALKTRNRED